MFYTIKLVSVIIVLHSYLTLSEHCFTLVSCEMRLGLISMRLECIEVASCV